MSDLLIQRVKQHEGLLLKPKIDVAPEWVIGYGHDITAAEAQDWADGCTEEQAEDWLHEDLATALYGCDQNFSPWINDLDNNRQDVLVEMAFQLGIKGVLAFHHMLAAVQASDWDTASKEMLNSEWHAQTTARCEELANIMLTGEIQDGNIS